MDAVSLVLVILLGVGLAWIVITALNNYKHPPSK